MYPSGTTTPTSSQLNGTPSTATTRSQGSGNRQAQTANARPGTQHGVPTAPNVPFDPSMSNFWSNMPYHNPKSQHHRGYPKPGLPAMKPHRRTDTPSPVSGFEDNGERAIKAIQRIHRHRAHGYDSDDGHSTGSSKHAGRGSDADLSEKAPSEMNMSTVDVSKGSGGHSAADRKKKQLAVAGPTDKEKEEMEAAAAQPPAKPKVCHLVEYQNAAGERLKTIQCTDPFEFQEDEATKNAVLVATTVLQTSASGPSTLLQGDVADSIPVAATTVRCTKIRIASPFFVEELREIVRYDTGTQLESTVLELAEPYAIISHHLDELKRLMHELELEIADRDKEVIRSRSRNHSRSASRSGSGSGSSSVDVSDANDDNESVTSSLVARQENDRQTCEDIRAVVAFVDSALARHIFLEHARHRLDVPQCTFNMLWYLFRPDTPVYVVNEADTTVDAYMVESANVGPDFSLDHQPEHQPPLTLHLWSFELDRHGSDHLVRIRRTITLQPFPGERQIITLNVYPCDVWDKVDGQRRRCELEKRGKKWHSLLSGKQVEYVGAPRTLGTELVEGRVYVDYASFRELRDDVPERPPMYEDAHRAYSKWGSYDKVDIAKVKEAAVPERLKGIPPLPCSMYMLFPRMLGGFVFQTHSWHALDVRFCHVVKANKEPFEKLVISEAKKTLIRALVYKHLSSRHSVVGSKKLWGADFIQNKGEGVLFLLHGGPGVGKTLTAECIAEFMGRPLLSLTGGDVGTDDKMEQRLRRWFYLASKWGAVLLIDQADVFFEKQTNGNRAHNSLVSAFLREVEYYQGILFLTTSRVGRIDDAFISRMHAVIFYPDLSDSDRQRIWNQLFDKLEGERNSTIRIDKSAQRHVLQDPYMLLAKWNGREIRNAFQTAVALADYSFTADPDKDEDDVAVLTDKHFKQACDMALEFKEYLKDINDGLDERQRAQ